MLRRIRSKHIRSIHELDDHRQADQDPSDGLEAE